MSKITLVAYIIVNSNRVARVSVGGIVVCKIFKVIRLNVVHTSQC